MSKVIESIAQEIERTCKILLEDRALETNRMLAFKKGLESIVDSCDRLCKENWKEQWEKK